MVEDLMALATVSDPDRARPTDARRPVDGRRRRAASSSPRWPPQAELELEPEIADGLVVAGEASGLQRMVTNLLSNAIKYTPAGRSGDPVAGAGSAWRAATGPGSRCVDTGIGIDASELDQRLRAVLPLGQQGGARAARHRSRAGDHRAGGQGPPGHRRRPVRAGRGHHLHRVAPARPGPATYGEVVTLTGLLAVLLQAVLTVAAVPVPALLDTQPASTRERGRHPARGGHRLSAASRPPGSAPASCPRTP